ncbi:ABC transporter [Parenemella sanctibonifatiensis]|uniref:ABC transporter n=2 Tax=Parenemella sanctibonifatiensis TaxID=2016505 RepID=A0A255EEH5_9ACTN|nr:ABC transporter [Parenemella sanctibonifatiensis]
MAMVISARQLTKTYGSGPSASRALDRVDLDLERGTTAIMGPSGSGKTTLLHCLAGIISPSGGEVRYADQDLARMGDGARTKLRRTDFGFVFQSGQLLAELPAVENVALPMLLAGRGRKEALKRSELWLERLGLRGMEARRPGELSGGQEQRVAIARALVTEPSVIFADEPTGALDQATGHDVLQVLTRTVRVVGAALVVVTHDPGVARHCDRTIEMRDGHIVADHRRPATIQGAR